MTAPVYRGYSLAWCQAAGSNPAKGNSGRGGTLSAKPDITGFPPFAYKATPDGTMGAVRKNGWAGSNPARGTGRKLCEGFLLTHFFLSLFLYR